jgi:imidazolonepropionase-like amidohydrolase
VQIAAKAGVTIAAGTDFGGGLTVGGPADFFLVHGNPLEDPSSLWRVWRSD